MGIQNFPIKKIMGNKYKPELIVIAGPNGSGKTSITQQFLYHEWAEGTLYINPDQAIKHADSQHGCNLLCHLL